MFNLAIRASSYIIILAVIGTFLAATILFLHGAIHALLLGWSTLEQAEVTRTNGKMLVIEFIEIVDQFLLGTVLYISSIGLLKLFVREDTELPSWLKIKSLDDLKVMLVKVVIVVYGVAFLGDVIAWNGQSDLLPFGASVALVIAALALFLHSEK